MPDDSKVFDVSKPNRSAPSPTSRPIIVGSRPQNSDPMVNDEHKNDDSSSTHTPIHVSVNDDGPTDIMAKSNEPELPSIAKEDIEKALASLNPKDEQSEETHNSIVHEPVVHEPEIHELTHEEPVHKPEFLPHTDEPQVSPNAPAPEEEPTPEHHEDEPVGGFTPIHQLIPNGSEDDHKKSSLPDINDAGWQDVPPLPIPQGAGPKRRWPKILFLLVILAIIGVYFAIDGGLVQSDVNLPFHILNKQKSTKTTVTPPPPTPQPTLNNNSNKSSNVPAGFTSYKLSGTNLSFAYLTAWGAPTVTADPGFSKRGGTNKSDGTHAYIVKFATNKDVEVAVTSPKYLPAARGTQYFDFLQWCTGTNDQKFYKQILHFSTAAGVDTASTITCDQGPLSDATKLDEHTIVQLKTKDSDGKTVLGDLYTQNLTDNSYTALRVKDSAMKNSDNIKKLLSSIKVSANSSTEITQ